MNLSWSVVGFAAVLSASTAANAQFVMMPDSTNNRVALFDPNTGALINSAYFGLNSGTTPVHALQVDSEIWVSEQIGDKISRYSLTGTPLAPITGGLDNIRGMGYFGGKVYVTNSGTANGAPGAAVITYDTAGNNTATWTTPSASSPFGVLEYPGGMLVSSSNANDDIHKYSLSGASLGTFHNSTSINFAEQMDYAANGDVLVAVFTSNIVARLNPTTGAIVSSFAAPGARGVYQLGNGNIMWSSGAGAFVYDVGSGVSSQVYAGGGRYLDFLNIPAPSTAGALALMAVGAARRRR
ncbi:MAG: hypothetical protein J0L61_13290 [Planctomycetes bacterium]|nr:hypothetical protein [Planctomycetota bacterium]